jgi:hypothetical protein
VSQARRVSAPPLAIAVEDCLRLPDVVAMIRSMDWQFRQRGAHGSWGLRFHYGPGGRFLTLEFGPAEVKFEVEQLTTGRRSS